MKKNWKGMLFAGLTALCCIILSCSAFVPADRTRLRAFPYPYRAMLTIQSHIDGTTLAEFEEIHTYLNTTVNTIYGDGLGLDIGDSLWIYNANDGNSYMKNDTVSSVSDYMTWFDGMDPTVENCAEEIIKYWKKGWIDSIHSFGDFSRDDGTFLCDRSLAVAAWDAMCGAGVHPTVWINHGTETNKQNFGGYTPITATKYQAGDDPDSAFYHTDLSMENGVKFVWNSRNHSSFGMENPLYLTKLRDGQLIWCFNAYTGSPGDGDYNYMWSPYQLHEVLTKGNLDALMETGEYAIIANHFGSGDMWEMLGEHNLPAFRLLRDYHKAGSIMVVRSSRLLEYAAVRDCIRYRADGDHIDILSVNDPVVGTYVPTAEELHGITFYVTDSAAASITIAGEPVEEAQLVRNEADETGRESIGFVWYRN